MLSKLVGNISDWLHSFLVQGNVLKVFLGKEIVFDYDILSFYYNGLCGADTLSLFWVFTAIFKWHFILFIVFFKTVAYYFICEKGLYYSFVKALIVNIFIVCFQMFSFFAFYSLLAMREGLSFVYCQSSSVFLLNTFLILLSTFFLGSVLVKWKKHDFAAYGSSGVVNSFFWYNAYYSIIPHEERGPSVDRMPSIGALWYTPDAGICFFTISLILWSLTSLISIELLILGNALSSFRKKLLIIIADIFLYIFLHVLLIRLINY
ncbi:MAG: hypothetical protein GQF41_4548 [Candidatus Rifleibacterium amylolyticum]|nr:MAG: hypothetical protein GQF41_4548 [Candidatus Rifleibacterium amylolyticum]